MVVITKCHEKLMRIFKNVTSNLKEVNDILNDIIQIFIYLYQQENHLGGDKRRIVHDVAVQEGGTPTLSRGYHCPVQGP